jgi:hypothetical protein
MANIITPQLDALMLTSANQRKVCDWSIIIYVLGSPLHDF